MSKVQKATVKETGETLNVYRLSRGTYYDRDNMGENQPPSATRAGKKEFEESELDFEGL